MTNFLSTIANEPVMVLVLVGIVGVLAFDLLVARKRRRAKRVQLESSVIPLGTLAQPLSTDRDEAADGEELDVVAQELPSPPVLPTVRPPLFADDDSAGAEVANADLVDVVADANADDSESRTAEDVDVSAVDGQRTRAHTLTVDDLIEPESPETTRERVRRIIAQRRKAPSESSRDAVEGAVEAELPVQEVVAVPVDVDDPEGPVVDGEKGEELPADHDVEFESVKSKVRDFYVELKRESKRLAEEREDFERERLAFARERADSSVRTETASTALSALDEQHEVLDREQRELINERARLREMRAELEGARAALEAERLNVVREKTGIDSLRERLEEVRDEMEAARERLKAEAAELTLAQQKFVDDRAFHAQEAEKLANEQTQVENSAAALTAQQDQLRSRERELQAGQAALEEQLGTVAEREAAIEGRELEIREAEARLQAGTEELQGRSAELDAQAKEIEIARAQAQASREETAQTSADLERRLDEVQEREAAVVERETSLRVGSEEFEVAQVRFQEQQEAWSQERARLEEEIAGMRESEVQAADRISALQKELTQERDLLVKTRASLAEERERLAEARTLTDGQLADAESDRRHAASLQSELDAVRLELEESRERLVQETRRRSEAEQARRLSDEARASSQFLDGYLDSTDPRFARLLDRQWDLWVTGENK